MIEIIGEKIYILNIKHTEKAQEQNHQLTELFEMDNVLLTPHVGGWTVESYIKISQTLAKKIKDLKLVGE